jgi:hypothetical protein
MPAEGYLGNLTAAQETVLSQFSSQLPAKCISAGLQGQDLVIWGVDMNITNEKQSKSQSVVLLKFLRARKFDFQESATMIINCLKWRKDFKVSTIKNETFSPSLQNGGLIHGRDMNGCPVTYNFYGKMNFDEIFSAEDGVEKFIRWRVQLQERAIELLDFNGGIEHIMQIHEYSGLNLSLE